MAAMKTMCVVLALAVLAVNIEADTPVADVQAHLQENKVSAQCPNGESYWLECNRCRCNSHAVGACTLAFCINFKCPAGDNLRGACGEKCSCDSASKITTCNKICPTTNFATIHQHN